MKFKDFCKFRSFRNSVRLFHFWQKWPPWESLYWVTKWLHRPKLAFITYFVWHKIWVNRLPTYFVFTNICKQLSDTSGCKTSPALTHVRPKDHKGQVWSWDISSPKTFMLVKKQNSLVVNHNLVKKLWSCIYCIENEVTKILCSYYAPKFFSTRIQLVGWKWKYKI